MAFKAVSSNNLGLLVIRTQVKRSISDILGNRLCLLLDNKLIFFSLEELTQFSERKFSHPASQYSGHPFQGMYKGFKWQKN